MVLREQIEITAAHPHGLRAGNEILVTRRGRGRLARLWFLLTRPRIQFVSEVNGPTTMTIVSRRMTWAEWWKALWRLVG